MENLNRGIDRYKLEEKNQIEILKIPEIRISSASFIRITRIKNGKLEYALLINKNRADKGEIVLTPIGGAIEATTEGKKELKKLLNINDDAFEKKNDLRFTMEGKDVNEYLKWFMELKDEQRESNPNRELIEELVKETKLLNNTDLEEITYKIAGYATELAETTRTGQEGKITLRLLEIFDVKLKLKTLEKLDVLASDSESSIKFVTAKDIINGHIGEGEDRIEIGSVAKSLLDPDETIAEFK